MRWRRPIWKVGSRALLLQRKRFERRLSTRWTERLKYWSLTYVGFCFQVKELNEKLKSYEADPSLAHQPKTKQLLQRTVAAFGSSMPRNLGNTSSDRHERDTLFASDHYDGLKVNALDTIDVNLCPNRAASTPC